ncbi:MAG TPA: MBL fold metallo-hydrolase [Magnetospirillum sp.]|nr:MBL fold metallo-hydrolase [Magnetospirillum sp.]
MSVRTHKPIRIRMYRVGFGDCFLLSFPTEPKRHVLVDCGVHPAGDLKVMRDVIADIRAETEGRLALVVATHAHKDHISGFGDFADQFRDFEAVDEVWLPWTEDQGDPAANALRKKQAALATALLDTISAMAAHNDKPRVHAALAAAQNLTGNGEALALLRKGIKGGRVRYLHHGAVVDGQGLVPGLSVKLLGPPKDPAFLKRMDPPKGDRLFRMEGDKLEAIEPVLPFGPEWVDQKGTSYPTDILPTKPDKKWMKELAADPSALAFALEQAINNTSLVTHFAFEGRHMLFAGDAQYGNWQYWLDDPEAADILGSLNVLKVSHHGSHNATPRRVVQMMPENVISLVSTQISPWPSIPRQAILDALAGRKSLIVRSDWLKSPNAPEELAPPELPRNVTAGGLYYDVEV